MKNYVPPSKKLARCEHDLMNLVSLRATREGRVGKLDHVAWAEHENAILAVLIRGPEEKVTHVASWSGDQQKEEVLDQL